MQNIELSVILKYERWGDVKLRQFLDSKEFVINWIEFGREDCGF